MGLTVLIFSQPITIRLAALRAHYARPCIGIDVETFGTFRKPKRREFDESARKRATKIQSNGSPHKPTVTTFQRYADPKVSIKEAVDADQILESIKNVESLSKTMRKPKRKISFSPKSDESMKDSSAVSKESQNSPLLKIDDSLAREIERQAMVLRMRKFFNTTPIEPELPPPIQFIRKYVEDPDDETDQMRAIRKKKEKESLLLAPVKRSRGKLTFSKFKSENEEEKDRPFTLPAGKFKPKQSLGQNFLSDQNYVLKICDAFNDGSAKGKNVVEIGPGPGALTRVLYSRYPSMTAIEVDERAVEFLHEKLPGKILGTRCTFYISSPVLLFPMQILYLRPIFFSHLIPSHSLCYIIIRFISCSTFPRLYLIITLPICLTSFKILS